jgi:hypothetical protein
MSSISLQTTSVNYGRRAVVLLAGMAVMVLGFLLVIQFSYLPTAVKIAGLVASCGANVAVVSVGMRRWAGVRVRYELDEAGLREIGASGELRDRVRWRDMHEYVMDAVVTGGANVNFLLISRRQGNPIRITEPQTREGRAEFAAFYSHFLAAIAQQRVTEPTAAVREGISWYDKPLARALGVTMLVVLVLAISLSFIFPQTGAGLLQIRSLVWVAIAVPFIYRTVFNRKAVPAA